MNAAVAPYARRIGRVKSFRPIRGPGARARPPPLAVGDSESRGCRTRPSDRDRGIRSASTTCARSPRHRKWRRNCFAWRVPARRPESLQDSAGLGRNQDPVVLSLQMYRSAAGNVLGTNSRQSSVGHSAQGFEFDYCGVILGNDLVWREDEGWVSNKADSSDNAILRMPTDERSIACATSAHLPRTADTGHEGNVHLFDQIPKLVPRSQSLRSKR